VGKMHIRKYELGQL